MRLGGARCTRVACEMSRDDVAVAAVWFCAVMSPGGMSHRACIEAHAYAAGAHGAPFACETVRGGVGVAVVRLPVVMCPSRAVAAPSLRHFAMCGAGRRSRHGVSSCVCRQCAGGAGTAAEAWCVAGQTAKAQRRLHAAATAEALASKVRVKRREIGMSRKRLCELAFPGLARLDGRATGLALALTS